MSLYSTIWCDQKPGFPADVRELHRGRVGRRGVFRVVRRLRPGDAILLNGALGAGDLWFDMLLALYIRWCRREVGVLIADATWHPRALPEGSRAGLFFPLYAAFLRLLLLLSRGPFTHYAFLSTLEVELVTREARLRPGTAHFTPFCSQLPLDILCELRELSAASEARDGRGGRGAATFFSGGNALRDYDTLTKATAGTPAVFTIATTRALEAAPSLWRVGPLSHHDFFREMARCDVVVLALWPAPGRSVGQQTYLNALALGKPLIVTDVAGVRDHLVPDLHALVVPPRDPAALRAAITWMSDPAHRLLRDVLAQNGQLLAEGMTFGHYIERLCALLRKVQEQLPLRTGPTAWPTQSA